MDMYIDGGGFLKVRFQSFNETKVLRFDERIEAGEDYHVSFTFDEDSINLYVDGALAATESGFSDGMMGNLEDLGVGAVGERGFEAGGHGRGAGDARDHRHRNAGRLQRVPRVAAPPAKAAS